MVNLVKSISPKIKSLKEASSRNSESSQEGSFHDVTLEELGYKSELKREFSYFSAYSFAVSASGLFGSVATTFYYPLLAGGSAAAVWCWLISGFGCMCLALSVAELVSSYPTSGGLYYACSRVYPDHVAPLMCWVDGYLNIAGQICGVASTAYGAAGMLLMIVTIGTDGDYVASTGATIGVMAGILVFEAIISILPTKYLEKCTKWYVVFHFLALAAGIISLLVMTDKDHNHQFRNDAKYVFTNITPTSGWTPKGFSFLFGFLCVNWVMTDYDATSHITEEMRTPELMGPWAISMAMLSTYLLGFAYCVVLCFCMGDPANIVNAQQPVIQIYYNALGRDGAIAFGVFMFVINLFIGFCALQAASRTVWSQARDKMYPGIGSKILYNVNPLTKTPVNAVIFLTVLCIAINLIALGSEQTIDAIFDTTAVALDISYCIPIAGKLIYPQIHKKGPWNLGIFSYFVNGWACLWTLFVSIIFFFPTSMPATKENMNYCVIFFVFVIAASLLVWVCGGFKLYKGPAKTAPNPEDEFDAAKNRGKVEINPEDSAELSSN